MSILGWLKPRYCKTCGLAYKPNNTEFCDKHWTEHVEKRLEEKRFLSYCKDHRLRIEAMMVEDEKKEAEARREYFARQAEMRAAAQNAGYNYGSMLNQVRNQG